MIAVRISVSKARKSRTALLQKRTASRVKTSSKFVPKLVIWSLRTDLAAFGPYAMTSSQIFSHSVNNYILLLLFRCACRAREMGEITRGSMHVQMQNCARNGRVDVYLHFDKENN